MDNFLTHGKDSLHKTLNFSVSHSITLHYFQSDAQNKEGICIFSANLTNSSGKFLYLNCIFPKLGETKTTFVWRPPTGIYSIVSVDWSQSGKYIT